MPQHVLSILAAEWHFYQTRRGLPLLRQKYAKSSGLLVNFGAGSSGKLGWVNVDGFQQPGITCLLDGRASMPFQDSSVRGFYSEHFFEHLRYPEDAGHFLKECHRVLQPGAVVRLIVPDGEAYLRAYCETGWDRLAALVLLIPFIMILMGMDTKRKWSLLMRFFVREGNTSSHMITRHSRC